MRVRYSFRLPSPSGGLGAGRRTLLAAVALAAATAALCGESPAGLEAEFKAACRRMTAERLKGTGEDVLGRDGWVVLSTELWYAAGGAFWGEAAREVNFRAAPDAVDPLPAVLDFNAQLAARGITLIFMPVPTRIVVYPEAILGMERFASFRTIPDLHTPEREFLALLRSHGVKVVELTPLLLASRGDPHAPLFVPSDSHWTGAAIALASAQISRLIRAMPFYPKAPKRELVALWRERIHVGHIYGDLHEKAGLPERPGDHLWLRTVALKTPDGEKHIEMRNPESPVVVIGDSNTICWKDQDSALFQQLSVDLGFPVDELATSGGGATNARLNLVRTALAEPGYLTGKKVLVWCFTSRSFHNSQDGWRLVPLDAVPAPSSVR